MFYTRFVCFSTRYQLSLDCEIGAENKEKTQKKTMSNLSIVKSTRSLALNLSTHKKACKIVFELYD